MDASQGKTRIVTLCHDGGCPTLELQQEGVLIKDDFGGQVFLTPEQWGDLLLQVDQKQFADWTFPSAANS